MNPVKGKRFVVWIEIERWEIRVLFFLRENLKRSETYSFFKHTIDRFQYNNLHGYIFTS